VKVRKQDFVLYEGIKLRVNDLPDCYGEQEIGSFRPHSLGPSLGPAGWYVHRLIDWIPMGLLDGQDSVIDDIVRWVVLQNDPLQQQLINRFPEYMEGVQLQLPPLAAKPASLEERVHHFTVTLRVMATDPSAFRAKDKIIAEIEDLMRWPSPMTIVGIDGVRRIPDGVPE